MPAYLQMLQEYLQNATTNENIDSELENKGVYTTGYVRGSRDAKRGLERNKVYEFGTKVDT